MVTQDKIDYPKPIETLARPSSIRSDETNTPIESPKVTLGATSTAFPTLDANQFKPMHDLLFLSAGELRVWSRKTGKVESVLQAEETPGTPISTNSDLQRGRVVEYRVDSKNQHVVLLKSRGVSANGVELFDLEIVNLATGTRKLLLNETPAVYNIGISPGGEWVTYTYQIKGDGPISVINTQEISEPKIIGTCRANSGHDCEIINWVENQNGVMWIDKDGVWLSTPPGFEPLKIIENQVSILDLDGNDRLLEVNFSRLRWSPQGRYLLAEIRPLRSDVHWQGVVDTFRGEVIEVPGSYEYAEPAAVVEWLPNGNLLVVQYKYDASLSKIYVTIYNVFPTSDAILMREQELNIEVEESSSDEVVLMEEVDFFPRVILPSSNRIIWILLINNLDRIQYKLYQVDIKFRMVRRTYELPIGEIGYHWSPYSAEAILDVQPDGLFYFRENINTISDVRTILGEEVCCFSWIP